MEILRYMVLSAASLFVIMDPIATVPVFLAMTPNDSPESRIRMARLACIIAAFILIVFDVARDRAFWLHIQEYVRGRRGVLEESREMVNVQIPLTNKLTQKSIELFRTLSLKMVESLHDRERMQHVKKKPR